MPELKNIIECPHCKGKEFTILESIVWSGFVDEDDPHIIQCKCKTSEIAVITCKTCEKDINEINNPETNFNFN